MAVPVRSPMLATSSPLPSKLEGWTAEPKVDGWRAIVTVEGGRVRVRTRSGRLLDTGVEHLESLAGLGVELCLDAELAVGSGHPDDFNRVASALGRASSQQVTLWVFDLLWGAGEDLCGVPHAQRRARLELLELEALAPAVRVVPSFPAADLEALYAACDSAGMEGVVAKDGRSLYLPGRRSAGWRKLKCSRWRELHAPKRVPSARRRDAQAPERT